MGRSRPSYRNCVEEFKHEMETFQKWMRRHRKPAFYRVWTHAHFHADSTGAADLHDPEKAALFSMIIGLQLEIMNLRRELDMDIDIQPGVLISEND